MLEMLREEEEMGIELDEDDMLDMGDGEDEEGEHDEIYVGNSQT